MVKINNMKRNKDGTLKQYYKEKRDSQLKIRCSKKFKDFVKKTAEEKGITQVELIQNAVKSFLELEK